MHRRPKLHEAIEVLQTISAHNDDAQAALADYNNLMANDQVFLASRMVVDIVDHYYHLQGISHG
jgi:hypothetical protein